MDLHALTSNNPDDPENRPEPFREPAVTELKVEAVPVVIPVAPVAPQPLAIIPAAPVQSTNAIFWHVHSLVGYYLIITMFAAWLLLNVWGGDMSILRRLGVTETALKDPLLKTAGYMVVGSIFGSVHYQIKVLYQHYLKKGTYDYRWIGKYISAPWESALMALVVFGLVRGGIGLLGGSGTAGTSPTGNFAALGIGALVGFGMREVVGWVQDLVGTMFGSNRTQEPPVVTLSNETISSSR